MLAEAADDLKAVGRIAELTLRRGRRDRGHRHRAGRRERQTPRRPRKRDDRLAAVGDSRRREPARHGRPRAERVLAGSRAGARALASPPSRSSACRSTRSPSPTCSSTAPRWRRCTSRASSRRTNSSTRAGPASTGPSDGVTTYGSWQVAYRIADPHELLEVYAIPNDTRSVGPCPDYLADPLILWVHAQGTVEAIYAPVDECGFPRDDAVDRVRHRRPAGAGRVRSGRSARRARHPGRALRTMGR